MMYWISRRNPQAADPPGADGRTAPNLDSPISITKRRDRVMGSESPKSMGGTRSRSPVPVSTPPSTNITGQHSSFSFASEYNVHPAAPQTCAYSTTSTLAHSTPQNPSVIQRHLSAPAAYSRPQGNIHLPYNSYVHCDPRGIGPPRPENSCLSAYDQHASSVYDYDSSRAGVQTTPVGPSLESFGMPTVSPYSQQISILPEKVFVSLCVCVC